MKFNKAVECDQCGVMELSNSKRTFKNWFKFIGWLQSIKGNGTTNEFCSKECAENYKLESNLTNKITNNER